MNERNVIRTILIGFGFLVLILFALWQFTALFLRSTGEVESRQDSPLVFLMQVPSPTPRVVNSAFIGWVYPPLPSGLRQSGYAKVGTFGGINYGISQVISMDSRMLWLLRTEYDADGSERWVIMDVLDLSHLQDGEGVLWNACRFQGRLIKNIVVIGPMDNDRILQPRLAWIADGTAGKFMPLEPEGFTCDLGDMGT